MTLYYSPSFTGECYRNLPVNETQFEKVVGDAGLLEFLELRLGLPGVESDGIDRLLAYKQALGVIAAESPDNEEKVFYKDAFVNDSLATAKEILRWRDIIVMEGFDPDAEYKSPRLRTMAEVERIFSKAGLVGTPERWKKVCEYARWKKINGVKIVVRHDKKLSPKLIQEALKVFDEDVKAKDAKDKSEAVKLNAKGKVIHIKRFNTVNHAFFFAATNKEAEVVICPDSFSLNAVLRGKGKEALGTSAGGDSPIIQLFRLGLSMLERPVDVRNLLSYLTTDYSPLPNGIRYKLASALKRDGGIGKEWEEVCEYNGSLEFKESFEVYLNSLLKADLRNDKFAPVSLVIKWCENVKGWAENAKKKKELANQRAYFANLSKLCGNMCRVLENEAKSEVEVDFISKVIKTLSSPEPVQLSKAEADCWNVVDSHRCFVDFPDSLLWVPCNGSLETPYAYSFMLQEEINELGIASQTEFVRHDFLQMVELLQGVNNIDLYVCDYDMMDALVEHPAVTLCRLAVKDENFEDLRGGDLGRKVFTPIHTINTGVDLYHKREKNGDEVELVDFQLSASSIETLISNPFDFVMNYTLNFRDLSNLGFSALIPTQGTVAHYIFETMMDDSKGDISMMLAMLDETEFERRARKAAERRGGILLLKEYKTLYINFVETVRNSIRVLLDILKQSHLTPKSCEVQLNDVDLVFSKIKGSVDFYAETVAGDIVVIDFKYSKNKSYIKSLEENRSIQLETYSQALEKMFHKPVIAKGYYFFPINQLHTDDQYSVFIKHPNVYVHKKIVNGTSLIKRIENSIDYRKTKQLIKGVLEMEEGSKLANIDYHIDAVKDGAMLDIPADNNNKEVKAKSSFANPNITKYPVLKDIIK